MKVNVYTTSEEMGAAAALQAADYLRGLIAQGVQPRLLLSTGASQFLFFKYFV